MTDEIDPFEDKQFFDPIEDDFLESLEDEKKFLINLENTLKKELSIFREDMQRLIESLPDKNPSPDQEGYEAFVRIETEIKEIKQKINQKNTELMDIKHKLSEIDED